MPGLYSAMLSCANALEVYSRALSVMQNNVVNANTPGYARQTQTLVSLPFDAQGGAPGGVNAGEVQSARSSYAEQSVRRETSGLGEANQSVQALTSLQAVFDVTGDSGIPYALNNLFQSFSAWAQSPSSTVARENALDRAGDVARAFRETAAGLAKVQTDTETQLRQTVGEINRLTAKLADFNQVAVGGTRNDAGLDAQVTAALEELSQYVEITAARQEDGSVRVLMGGQVPLLLEGRQYPISYRLRQPDNPPPTNADAPPSAEILLGTMDVTSKVSSGQLGALLDMRNRVLPTCLGDAYSAGDLNVMAKAFADRVNDIFVSGNVSDGPPAETGVPLFTYDAASATATAKTLQVDSSVTSAQLAAIDPGPPQVSNGIPLRLAALASPVLPEDQIDGASYSEYYGRIAANAGAELNAAEDRQQVRQSTVAQAKDLRQQMSGVSLDQEAMVMMEFQRAFQASSRMIRLLDELTQEVLNMLQR